MSSENSDTSNNIIDISRLLLNKISKDKHRIASDSQIELRRDLVVKIHRYRRDKEFMFFALDITKEKYLQISESLLCITCKYVDFMLGSDDISTMELLNKYSEYKKIMDAEVELLIDKQ